MRWSMSPTNGNMPNTAKTAEFKWFFFFTICFLYVILCHKNRVKQHAKLLKLKTVVLMSCGFGATLVP